MSKEHPTIGARQERDAARQSRNERIEEVIYLLSALAHPNHPLRKGEWHLAPVNSKHVSRKDISNYVLCVHIRRQWQGDSEVRVKKFAWRFHDPHVHAFFSDLELRACHDSVTREEKLRLLAELAADRS